MIFDEILMSREGYHWIKKLLEILILILTFHSNFELHLLLSSSFFLLINIILLINKLLY